MTAGRSEKVRRRFLTLIEKQAEMKNRWNQRARLSGNPSLSQSREYVNTYRRILTALQIDNLGMSQWGTEDYREYHKIHRSRRPALQLVSYPNLKARIEAERRCRVAAQPPSLSPEEKRALERARENSYGRQRYAKGTDWVRQYFATHPCVDCGENDPDVMDFDHREPELKEGSVCEIARKSITKAEAEAAKCDVRCANCHRRRHARERRANAVPKA